MIDWLTLATDPSLLDVDTRAVLESGRSTIFSISPEGEINWEKRERKVLRSDSHQITVDLGCVLRIMGSPARVGLDRIDNVFGSGDPIECAKRMIAFVNQVEGIQLPDFRHWECSRIDVTHNYDMGSLANVKAALGLLRHCEGGRYQVRTSAESVYWSPKSSCRSGKAYSKGEHMRHLARQGRAHLSEAEQAGCDRLIRLELKLGRHFFSKVCKKAWHQLSESELDRIHDAYFGALVGSVEVHEMTDIEQACIEAAKELGYTEGAGKAAHMAWAFVQAYGYNEWKAKASKATFYRHKKIMKAAGLSYADFQQRRVVPIRRRAIVLDQPVRSWADLLKAA